MNLESAAILSTYLSWIGDLVVGGYFSAPDQERISQIARARTMATLRMLQAQEKSVLIHFLFDAGLIVNQGDKRKTALIALNGADLKGLDCSHAQLDELCIISAYLNNANFNGAFLFRANFSACDLIEADLSFATLDEVNFLMADLTGANLKGASLLGTIISDEQLAQAACIEDIQR